MFSRKTVQRRAADEEAGYGEQELAKEKGTTPNETPQEKKDPLDVNVNNDRDTEPTKKPSLTDHNQFYWRYIIPTIIVLILPWMFFGLVKHHGGVRFSRRPSKWVNDHPKVNNFVFTSISTILNSIIGLLFGKAVTNLAKKWIAHKGTDIFGLSFFTGLRNRAIPWKFHWEWQYIKPLITRHLLWVMIAYMIVFHYISTSSISALITPGPFTRHATLQGQELDFGASGDDCATWFQENIINNDCGWAPYKGGEFTTCPVENQLVDVLESGRNNMLSLKTNASTSITMSQLGLPFLGPIRGVLPNGPNGIPQFNNFSSDTSPFDASAETGLTYNYTLQLQGLSSNVSCAHTPDTPIKYAASSPFFTYTGTCDDGQNFLNTSSFMIPSLASTNSNVFGFWACGSEQSYTVYLTGKYGYAQSIGNLACTVSPIVPAVFPVEYVGRTGSFSAKPPTSTSAGTRSELVSRTIESLGSVIAETQGIGLNAFADSVLTFGIKWFSQPTNATSDMYLRLFEAMIAGTIEYEATYIRLLYSTNSTAAPPTCFRTIDGSVDYQVIGWFVTSANGYLLIPLTIFNVTSLLMLIGAMLIGKEKKLFGFNPTLQNNFIFSSDQYVQVDPNKPKNWALKIEHGPTKGNKEGLRLKTSN